MCVEAVAARSVRQVAFAKCPEARALDFGLRGAPAFALPVNHHHLAATPTHANLPQFAGRFAPT